MADLHLDWPFAGLSADARRGRLRREELKAIFAGIIDLAAQERVQVLLLAGDLFEHAHATRGTIKFMDDQFRRIPGARIFIAPGNHDPFVDGSYYQTYPWAPNVHVFGPEPERVDLPDLPVSVYGWGFGTWEVRRFGLQGLRAQDAGRVNLAVFHGGDEAYHPFTAADLAAMGMDYIALGHIHKEGPVLEQAGRVIARYSGAPEALGFGDTGRFGVWAGEVSREYNRMRFVPTGLRRYVTVDVDVSGAVSLEDVAAAIRSAAPAAERAQHCWRLTLRGTVDPDLFVDVDGLQERLSTEFFVLKLMDATEPALDLEELAGERSARGLFVRKLLAQSETAASDGDRRTVRRALALGLAALAGKEAGR